MKQRWLLPVIYAGAAVFVVLGVIWPLWRTLLYFPQYPEGPLQVVAYAGALKGDLTELETLNHYIGVSFPTEVPELAVVPRLLYGVAVLGLVAGLVRGRTGLWLKGAALGTLGQSLGWALWRVNHYLTDFGASPDPGAPLGDLVKPFKPPLWGETVIVQVRVVAEFLSGTYFLALAGALFLLGFWVALRQHRSNYGRTFTDE